MSALESDFCVVGAGYAGLTAAYRLHQADHSVTVLEASPRIGGRTWSAELSNGTLFEIGGQWVADAQAQPDVRRLMDELGVEVYPQYDQGKRWSIPKRRGTTSSFRSRSVWDRARHVTPTR